MSSRGIAISQILSGNHDERLLSWLDELQIALEDLWDATDAIIRKFILFLRLRWGTELASRDNRGGEREKREEWSCEIPHEDATRWERIADLSITQFNCEGGDCEELLLLFSFVIDTRDLLDVDIRHFDNVTFFK